jgi:hypothetical protein
MEEESDGSAPVARADVLGTYELTDNNTVVSGDGVISFAAAPADDGDYLSRAAGLVFPDTVTFCLWYKSSQVAQYPSPFCHNPGVDGKMPIGVWMDNGSLMGTCTTSDNQRKDVLIKSQAGGATDGNWHFVVGWFDTSDKKGYFQWDADTPVATAAQAVATLRDQSAMTFNLGYWHYGDGADVFKGSLDEVYVFSVTKDSSWRTDMYNGGAGRGYPN